MFSAQDIMIIMTTEIGTYGVMKVEEVITMKTKKGQSIHHVQTLTKM